MRVMKTILQRWDFVRVLRLVLGGAILIQGIVANDVPTMLLGSLFGGMALANIGCCGTGGCIINTPNTSTKKTSSSEGSDDIK